MRNEKGLTLIEVLATIVILTLAISLIYGVMINIQKNYRSQANQGQLVQEANLILATVRQYHQKGTPYTFTSNSIGKVYIENTSLGKQQLGQDTMSVEISYGKDQLFNRNNNTVDYNPLFIKVKLTNQNAKSVEVDTIISNY